MSPFIIPEKLVLQHIELQIMVVWWEKNRLTIVKTLSTAFKNNLIELTKSMNKYI